jgi:hypothetical protein
MLKANDLRFFEPSRFGRYVCLRVPERVRSTVTTCEVAALGRRLGFVNEFATDNGHPPQALAFLRRMDAYPGAVEDEALLGADAVVHVASATEVPVTTFCTELATLLPPAVGVLVLGGVVKPSNYTGNALHNFAYAQQVIQQPGAAMPNAFLIPMRKTAAWWAKPWMERHTYFLPRYDDSGRMLSEGHALAAAAGVSCLLRRTYKNRFEPAPADAYDFVNYFECTDEDMPTFHSVCAALRDTTRNPEWKFVLEGPTWHGRRVPEWKDLFTRRHRPTLNLVGAKRFV